MRRRLLSFLLAALAVASAPLTWPPRRRRPPSAAGGTRTSRSPIAGPAERCRHRGSRGSSMGPPRTSTARAHRAPRRSHTARAAWAPSPTTRARSAARTRWHACAGIPRIVLVQFRRQGQQVPWGTIRWCHTYASWPSGCFDAGLSGAHEFGHIEVLNHSFTDTYPATVMRDVQAAYPQSGWNQHILGHCDVARLQMTYDVQSWWAPYSTCLDLATISSLSASASTVPGGHAGHVHGVCPNDQQRCVRAARRQPAPRPHGRAAAGGDREQFLDRRHDDDAGRRSGDLYPRGHDQRVVPVADLVPPIRRRRPGVDVRRRSSSASGRSRKHETGRAIAPGRFHRRR